MPIKPKRNQKELIEGVSGRDLFQTPYYATDLLLEFLPKGDFVVWEPACGEGKITNRLKHYYSMYSTDVRRTPVCDDLMNFITESPNNRLERMLDRAGWPRRKLMIVTNPPFSLKLKFYLKCREYGVPFALLVPADYSGWIIKAIQDGAEKIIPTRRIDYITPTGLSGATGHTSRYHSMWLTWGLGLGRTETFVELSLEDKKVI